MLTGPVLRDADRIAVHDIRTSGRADIVTTCSRNAARANVGRLILDHERDQRPPRRTARAVSSFPQSPISPEQSRAEAITIRQHLHSLPSHRPALRFSVSSRIPARASTRATRSGGDVEASNDIACRVRFQ